MAPTFESVARNADKMLNASSIINCENVEETLRWYQDVLGMQIEFAFGDPVIHGSVQAGATSFHFQQAPAPSDTSSYMTVYVRDLDDLFDDIEDRGATIVQEPRTMEWGMRAFMIHDCNGALVMFADPSTGE